MRYYIDDLRPAQGGRRLSGTGMAPAAIDPLIDRWLRSSVMRERAMAILGLAGGSDEARRRAGWVSDSDLRQRLRDAIRRGQIELVERDTSSHMGPSFEPRRESAASEPASTESTPPTRPEPKTWVEFQLVTEDGTGVGDVRYKVKLPGGATREGRTRPSGLIRIEDLDPGTCEIEFPDLDEKSWGPA